MDSGNLLGTIFFLLFAFLKIAQCRYVEDCYANNMNPYLDFGTKTSYEFVYERPKKGEREVPDCTPVQIWMLARHGTRYPGRGTIEALKALKELRHQIIRNHESGKDGKLCYADVENFKKWSFNVTLNDDALLTKQGEVDLYFLAKRIRTKFYQLFRQEYSSNLYIFRTTASERTRQSAQAFAAGLFGPNSGVWIPQGWSGDSTLKPYENCSYWENRVGRNPNIHTEAHLFTLSHHMNNVVHNVSRRLGFLYDLPIPTILAMYDMCRYDKAWHVSERSPWCAAFIKEDLQVLEYRNDLEDYYDASYGHHLNLKLGCHPLRDMMERFQQIEDENFNNGVQPQGIFYFTHSKMLLMTLSRLGIASGGYPLRHDNYDLQHEREWKTSYLAPFSGNLAAVFYKCTHGDSNRVMFLLNEKVIEYEGCDVGLCSWSYIRTRFQDIPYRCNLDWCRDASPRLQILLIPLIIFTIMHRFL